MKGLKIIPLFLALMVLVFLGMKFVDANRDEVVVVFAHLQSPPTPLGFVILTSTLLGMVVCGALCTIELLALYVQNRKLRARLAQMTQGQKSKTVVEAQDVTAPKVEGVHST